MSYKAILQELCGTALNYPVGELQELISKPEAELKPEEVTAISEKLKGHYRSLITTINKSAELNAQKQFDEKFKAGQRNKADEYERALKSKFGIDSDKQGEELIDEILTESSKKAGKKGDLTDDDVKKHPAFLKMESEFKKQVKSAQDEAKKQLEELQTKQQRKEVFANVSKKAMELFEEMKPVLSEDAKKAAAQRELLLEKLSGFDFEEVEGKIIVSKEGKVIENEFGHKLEFDALVKETASQYFDFKKAETRNAPNGAGSGAGSGNGQGGDHTYKGALPKNVAEWQTMMDSPDLSIKDKMAINDHWDKLQEAAASN